MHQAPAYIPLLYSLSSTLAHHQSFFLSLLFVFSDTFGALLSVFLQEGMAKDVEVAERGSFSGKDYQDPPPAPLIDAEELTKWSFYRALIAEFIATLLFLYITVLTVIGYKHQTDHADACGGVGILGIAWAFGGMIFILVYCTAGISGLLSFRSLPLLLKSILSFVMFAACFASSHLFALFTLSCVGCLKKKCLLG